MELLWSCLCNHCIVFVTFWRCRRPEGDLRAIYMQPQHNYDVGDPVAFVLDMLKILTAIFVCWRCLETYKVYMETPWRPNWDLLAYMKLYWRCQTCQHRHQGVMSNTWVKWGLKGRVTRPRSFFSKFWTKMYITFYVQLFDFQHLHVY